MSSGMCGKGQAVPVSDGAPHVNHPGVRPAKMVWRGTNGINSWAWSGCEGNKAVVEVYTDAAAVELYLNGKKIGKQKVQESRAIFKTRYTSGKLEAVAYDSSGREVSRNTLESAAGKLHISAAPETDTAAPGEVVYINIAIEGENGITESNADERLTVTVEGGELMGFGSANPRTEERFDSGKYTTYYGIALAAVRVGATSCRVTVTGDKLGSAVAQIAVHE